MGLLDELAGMGANIQEGLQRFANNAGLYEKMIKKFPAVANVPTLEPLYAGDIDAAMQICNSK